MSDNTETLLWLANFGCIEMNPWASRIGSLDRPDFLTIDLDPHGRSFDDVVTVALTLHRVLNSLKVRNFAKTSGKTGMHVMVPLAAKYDYEVVRDGVAETANDLLIRCTAAARTFRPFPDRRGFSGGCPALHVRDRKHRTISPPRATIMRPAFPRPYPSFQLRV